MTKPRAITESGWLAAYESRKGYRRRAVVSLALLSLSVLASGAFVAYRWYFAVTSYGPAAIWTWLRLPLFLMLILIAGTILSAYHFTRLANVRVQTHLKGIRILFKSRQVDLPWSSIQTLQQKVLEYGLPGWIWKREANIILLSTQGRKIKLDTSLENYDEMVAEIKQYCYPHIWKSYQEALLAGDTLDFGPLKLSTEYFMLGRKSYDWEALANCEIESGSLHLSLNHSKRNTTARLPSAKLLNADLCIQVLQQLSQTYE